MQDGCKVYMDSYMAFQWIMLHGHMDFFPKPPPGGRYNTEARDRSLPKSHNRQSIIFLSCVSTSHE